ncbi:MULTISPECIES: hypothetical protein [unclassified Pseudofrankia]|uniref:hypothetical protein n=1 Tax=unclassified Pseudofrankia TaxID=2994372 RepID=UPI0008DA8541|nr:MULTISPECIES: hypothetical protein [unclassified Pseudofrankia]MDT3441617.1 hypothetical protein [Pseudofrankia sp. BMG5.37]OHV45551.1 hypothetical protein BCD48_22475 [Pseudofrankia sp. BMG5.36]
MAKILLSLHVLAAILAIGPVAVAASIFPRYLRLAAVGPADGPAAGVARALHRICRVYALLGIAVPFFGLATAGPLHVFGDAWVIISIVLTAAAAALLAAVILPGQRRALATLPEAAPRPAAGDDEPAPAAAVAPAGSASSADSGGSAGSVAVASPARVATDASPVLSRAAARLGMTTGIFNLLWAAVVVLMIVRPGSTTGV